MILIHVRLKLKTENCSTMKVTGPAFSILDGATASGGSRIGILSWKLKPGGSELSYHMQHVHHPGASRNPEKFSSRTRDQEDDVMDLFDLAVAVPVPPVPSIECRTTVTIIENQPFLPTKRLIISATSFPS